MDLYHPLLIIPGTLASEDLTYLGALVLVQLGKLDAISFISYFSFGALLGDLGLYLIGHLLGRKKEWNLVKKLQLWLEPKLESSSHEMSSMDYFLLFTRVLPGSRIPTYVSCGIVGYSLKKFSMLLFFSAVFYCLVGVGLVELYHRTVSNPNEISFAIKLIIAGLAFLFTTLFFKFLFFFLKTKKKFGSILPFAWIHLFRLRYPEFWPSVALYLPFVPLFIYLLIKHRGFKALYCNPSIYMSGIKGEKKSDIDVLIKQYLPTHRLKTVLIKNPTKIQSDQIDQILLDCGLSFPIVVKPDSGLRGLNVCKVNNFTELLGTLKKATSPVVFQEFCPKSREWGTYFYRDPETNSGKIYSVNEKLFPFVIGDGESSLIDLVLKKPEYKVRYDLVTLDHSDVQRCIPKIGEVFPLVFRGSHSKGSLFIDAEHLLSEDLETVLVNCFSKIPDFNFGRIDLRFNTLDELIAGKFDIVEINGAGAESTNLYDPKYNLFQIYSILYKQWSHAFRIGHIMAAKSQKPSFKLSTFLYTWLLKGY